MFKAMNTITKIMSHICSKLTIKAAMKIQERYRWHRSSIFPANYERIIKIFLLIIYDDFEHVLANRVAQSVIESG